jgi:hypothetical protein
MAVRKKTTKRKTAAKATPSSAKKKARLTKKSGSGGSELKTKPTAASVEAFLAKVPNEQRRADGYAALALLKKATGAEPKMWGPSIIGFGTYHYKYESGREGDMCVTGFSPRGTATVFYVMGGAPEDDPLFARLGKFKIGKSCVYVNRLSDIDLGVMEKIIVKSVAYMKKTYKTNGI